MKPLAELSALINATLVGNNNLEITGAASISRAGRGDITFAVTQQHVEHFLSGDAPAAVVCATIEIDENGLAGKGVVLTNDAEAGFNRIVQLLRPQIKQRRRIGISPAANISDLAVIAEDVDVYPGAYVGDEVEIGCGSVIYPNVTILDNCKIGSNVSIFPGATLYENTIVGDRAIIHAGAVIGAFGFGYKTHEGRHNLSAQLGNVVIGNDVEIGANSTIDRGTYDATTVGEGTKIDDLVMIGHNCQIGRHNLLCSQVGIAGSSTTGDHVVMAGQVGIGDHLTIGDNVTLAAKAGVMHDLAGDQAYLGAPAIPAREQMQIFAVTVKLPEMRKQLKRLQQDVRQLGKQRDPGPSAEIKDDAA